MCHYEKEKSYLSSETIFERSSRKMMIWYFSLRRFEWWVPSDIWRLLYFGIKLEELLWKTQFPTRQKRRMASFSTWWRVRIKCFQVTLVSTYSYYIYRKRNHILKESIMYLFYLSLLFIFQTSSTNNFYLIHPPPPIPITQN